MRAFRQVVTDQVSALKALAQLTQRSVGAPIVRTTAVQIIGSCPSRDEVCELEAIYNAVKKGDKAVPALRYGFRYTHDPILFDSFTAPARSLELSLSMAKSGRAAAGDCDDHAALVAALCAAIGFPAGLRAYGRNPAKNEYEHVYAVVGLPKRKPTQWFGMDTTVDRAYPGWEPPKGRVMTAIITGTGG